MHRFTKTYADGWLILYIALAVLSSVRAAHGAFIFFGFIVDPWLAWVSTVVLALSVIGLDAAAAAERDPYKRTGYLAAALLFLVTETLANYFAGQAGFVTRIRAEFAGSTGDILTIANEQPLTTRALVVLFEATPSICVAGFTWASASRMAYLQRRESRPLLTRLRARARVWRVQLRNLRAQLATQATAAAAELRALRETLASSDAMLASVRAAAEQAREELAHVREHAANAVADCANLREALATEREAAANGAAAFANAVQELAEVRETAASYTEETANLREALAGAGAEVAQLREQVRTGDAARARIHDQLTQAREVINTAERVVPSRSLVVAYAVQAMQAGRSRSDVARELAFSESTLRTWLPDTKSSFATSAD